MEALTLMLNYSHEQLEAICERAVCYHRQVVAGSDDISPGMLEDIVGIPTHPNPRPNGWLIVGHVIDGREDYRLPVWWHPETDRVKLARPPVDLPLPTPEIAPLRHHLHPPYVIAEPGYIYTIDGCDYTPEEGLQVAIQRKCLGGWTWRPD